MENIMEKEQESYGITLYNANNEVIYNIAMPQNAGFDKAELKLLETMQEDESIEFATIQRGANYEKNVSKEYPRSYFNHKIKLYKHNELLDIIDTQSLRQGVAELKLIEAMQENPKITHGVIGFGDIKGKDNSYNCFICDKAYLADSYEGAFNEKELAKERILNENSQEKEFQKFIEDNIALSNKIIEFEKKESIYLPEARTRIFKEIVNDISKLDKTLTENYFGTKCDLDKILKPKEIITKFVLKNKEKVYSQTK